MVNFKAPQFPGFSSSPFEDRQHNRPSQPSCAATFFKGRRHPLVSILAFSHFISPQNSQMNTIRLWWFTALEFLKLLYNFLLRDFNLYKGHTLIFFAKCLWHRNFCTTLSSRHDARDSFNSSVSLLHLSPDPLYTDLWGSLGHFGAEPSKRFIFTLQVRPSSQLVFSSCSTEGCFCTLLQPLSSNLIQLPYYTQYHCSAPHLSQVG